MNDKVYLILENIRSGKTIRIQQEYEKAKADGKKVLFVDKEQLKQKLKNYRSDK